MLAAIDLNSHRPNKEATFIWELRPNDGVVDPNSTIYTDGSMVDGPTAEMGRVGFGFVATNEEGTITARAYGTPPSWIDTVPGAEAWAVHEAIRNMVPGCKIRSDCAAVVNRMKKGRASATSGKVKLARLWHKIFDMADAKIDIEWMPAHTAKWQVGKCRKSDGAKLTEEDRLGNAEADLLAKKGANTHRLPRWLRLRVETAERVALRAALQLGITTHAANNVVTAEYKADGTVGSRTLRDSSGMPKGSELRKAKTTPKVKTPKVKAAKSTREARAGTRGTSKEGQKARGRTKRKASEEPQAARANCSKEWTQRESLKLLEAAKSKAEHVSFFALGVAGSCDTGTVGEPAPKRRKLPVYQRPLQASSEPKQGKRRSLLDDVGSLVGNSKVGVQVECTVGPTAAWPTSEVVLLKSKSSSQRPVQSASVSKNYTSERPVQTASSSCDAASQVCKAKVGTQVGCTVGPTAELATAKVENASERPVQTASGSYNDVSFGHKAEVGAQVGCTVGPTAASPAAEFVKAKAGSTSERPVQAASHSCKLA